jgi:cytochrome P450 hydroxylase
MAEPVMTAVPVMQPADAVAALGTPEGRENPYPLYEAIRAHGNLVQIKRHRFVAVGYGECARALREPQLKVHDDKGYDLVYPQWRSHSSLRAFTGSILYRNPPDHGRLRGLVSGAFAPRRVQELRSVIEDMTDRLLDHVAGLGGGGSPVDIIGEFAARLPIAVISKMLGFPEDDQVWFRMMAADVAMALEGLTDMSALDQADAAMDDLSAYFAELIGQRLREPAGDLVSMLAHVHETDRDRLSHDELMGNMMLLLTAGFETTSFLLGHGVLLALDNAGFAGRLRTDPGFAPGYVEEILRFEPPVQVTSRWAAADVDLVGLRVPAGSKVVLMLGGGNRDPHRFAEPNRFDPDRRDNQQLSFGAGSHFCLGAPLARLEAQIALPRLFRRFPRLAAAGAPTHRERMVVRGLDTFPITVA